MRPVVTTALTLFALTVLGADDLEEFRFQRENVLGTSFELVVRCASEAQAEAVDARIMQEIARLSRILSTYDPQSEISRLNATRHPVKCSPELAEVLRACESWRTRSGGAFNPQLGRLIELWKEGEKEGKRPDGARLSHLVAEAGRPAYAFDDEAGTVRRLTDARLNVDGLAKGYIIDKAIVAAKIPGVRAVLLNIGGDIGAWTAPEAPPGLTWTIGVADPRRYYDNLAPRIRLHLRNGGIATSGHYYRYYKLGTQRYSHILDPRTGCPSDRIASSTVLAQDCATADALATILCVLAPCEALPLVNSIPGAECLIVAADGRRYTSDGWSRLAAFEEVFCAPQSNPFWPPGFQVLISIDLKFTLVRPYVAFWIEDASGKPVRTLEVWGKKEKYLRMMSSWWKVAEARPQLVTSVTRASRLGGQYRLLWDGMDDAGKPVPQGDYVVRVELYRKEGKRFDLRGCIQCREKPAFGKLPDCDEAKDILVFYGPKEIPK